MRGKQGRPSDSIAWCRRAIAEAEASGARDALAKAYYTLDMQYSSLGRLESVANSERALAIYEELGDLERQAIVLNSLGVYAHAQGRWNESVDLYERARRAWDQAGDHWAASFATTNRGEVLSDQGRFDEAEPLFRAALRIAQASQSPFRIADISVYLGRLLAGKGEFDEAQASLTEAREHFAESGDKGELLASDARIAECLVLAAKPDEARALADATFETAVATEGTSLLMPVLGRVRGCALMQLGRTGEAREALEETLSAARELKMDYEVALTLSALSALAAADGAPADRVDQERDAIFKRLGVVATPGIPVPDVATVQ